MVQLVLPLSLSLLNDLLKTVFKLMDDHKWNAVNQSLELASHKNWLEFQEQFLSKSFDSPTLVFYTEFRSLQLFYSALLKLFQSFGSTNVLFVENLRDILIAYGHFDV